MACRARLVLRRADRSEVCLGIVDRAEPCDLGLVHRLLTLHLGAVRGGGGLELRDVDPELRSLLDLVGVRDLLLP